MTQSDYMSREELMARTGLGPRQLNADIRAGLIPGHVTKAGKPRVPRLAYERMLAGELVAPAPIASEPRPQIGITRINARRKAS